MNKVAAGENYHLVVRKVYHLLVPAPSNKVPRPAFRLKLIARILQPREGRFANRPYDQREMPPLAFRHS